MKSGKHRTPSDYFEIAQKKKPDRTDFYERVYAVARNIPKGKVTSYGAIAEHLGLRSSARMVGAAMAAAPEGFDVPAHRVLNRTGALTAAHKFGGPARLRHILEKEGITFKAERVDMKKHFWQPK